MLKKAVFIIVLLTSFGGVVSALDPTPPRYKSAEEGVTVYTEELLSKPLTIDKIYTSMLGPYDKLSMKLPNHGSKPQLIWLKEIDFIQTDVEGNEFSSEKHLCHGQLFYASTDKFQEVNQQRIKRGRSMPRKMFTGIQGQTDLKLPEGFGIPMYTDEEYQITTMAFNLDPALDPFDLRIKTKIDYILDRDTRDDMRALGKSAIDITLPVDPKAHELLGEHSACGVTEDDQLVVGRHANTRTQLKILTGSVKGTNHFLVPPGMHEYKREMKGYEIVPYDTKVHVMTAHLHVYGKYMELVDLTEGKTVLRSDVVNDPNYHYVYEMTSTTSKRGIPLYQDHNYLFRAVYDNTTDKDIDAMAVMYFYFDDKEFNRSNN